MDTWQFVWRAGIAPSLTSCGLLTLRQALAADSPSLLQGATTSPPPLTALQSEPVEKCCRLGLALKADHGLVTVGDVQDAFAVLVAAADERLGEPAAVRHFINAWDDGPRDVMRQDLLAEVERVLALRGVPVEPAAA